MSLSAAPPTNRRRQVSLRIKPMDRASRAGSGRHEIAPRCRCQAGAPRHKRTEKRILVPRSLRPHVPPGGRARLADARDLQQHHAPRRRIGSSPVHLQRTGSPRILAHLATPPLPAARCSHRGLPRPTSSVCSMLCGLGCSGVRASSSAFTTPSTAVSFVRPLPTVAPPLPSTASGACTHPLCVPPL